MENKKSKVEDLAKFAKDGVITIKHLHGPAEKFLDPVKPLEKTGLTIEGNIGTIAEFLKKRIHLFDSKNCNIEVNSNDDYMRFTGNECRINNEFRTFVESQITETKHYEALEVNNDREFESLELARYLRKRKNMFVNPEQFNDVFTALSAFKAEISKQIEKIDKRDGNAVNSIRQTVSHNMPRHFELKIPIFENAPSIKIEIEVDVNPNNLECSLMSFDLEEKYDELKKSLFEDELDSVIVEDIKLRDLCVVYYS